MLRLEFALPLALGLVSLGAQALGWTDRDIGAVIVGLALVLLLASTAWHIVLFFSRRLRSPPKHDATLEVTFGGWSEGYQVMSGGGRPAAYAWRFGVLNKGTVSAHGIRAQVVRKVAVERVVPQPGSVPFEFGYGEVGPLPLSLRYWEDIDDFTRSATGVRIDPKDIGYFGLAWVPLFIDDKALSMAATSPHPEEWLAYHLSLCIDHAAPSERQQRLSNQWKWLLEVLVTGMDVHPVRASFLIWLVETKNSVQCVLVDDATATQIVDLTRLSVC